LVVGFLFGQEAVTPAPVMVERLGRRKKKRKR